MRRVSAAAAGFMILSGASLAQVGRSGDGKDVPYANQIPSNTAAVAQGSTANNTMAAEQAVNGSDQKTEPATPRR